MCTIVKDPSILIKCSKPSNADVESITCMALESATRSFHIYMIWIYTNKRQLPEDQFMPFSYLQSTLADTLNHFPILAGRLTEDASGNGTIHLNNAGVLFTEARCADKDVHYFFPHATSDDTDAEEEFDYEHINSANLEVAVSNTWTGPMMSVQATRLQCGSVILSMSAFHCLMDAQSTADFINAWAAGGKTIQHIPLLDKSFVLLSAEERARLEPITRPPECVFNRDITPSSGSAFIEAQPPRVISRVYHFSASELQKIKAAAMKDLPSNVDYISSYDALYAHMILVIASASQTFFTTGESIKVLQSLNGRSRFAASCSSTVLHYFGSFPFWLYGTVPNNEPPTLSSLSQFIHDMHSKQTVRSLKHFNAYLYSGDGDIRKNCVDADIINRDFHCTSWRKVNMLRANFGGPDNYPEYSGPTKHPYPRYFAMMDTRRKDESANIILGLREQDYQRMLQQNIIHKYR